MSDEFGRCAGCGGYGLAGRCIVCGSDIKVAVPDPPVVQAYHECAGGCRCLILDTHTYCRRCEEDK